MIYLDYNATTPVDERVISRILPFFSLHYGNAASGHPVGRMAREAVEAARQQIAARIGADSSELIFTSGATESCNLAIKGCFETYRSKGSHFITVATEHPAVLDSCRYLASRGAEITYLSVSAQGLIDLEELRRAIRPDTLLVAVMTANNETGVLQPIRAIGELCHERGVLFFTDATQALGKHPIDVKADHIDLMAFSGHKIYAPKGIGGLYISRKSPRVRLTEQMQGGGHEKGLRSGTLNVPGIVGMAAALDLFYLPETTAKAAELTALRNQLETSLTELPGVFSNVPASAPRLGHVANLRFESASGKQLMSLLTPQLAVSSGSACSTDKNEPSPVLMAMGLSETAAMSSIRFSLGRYTNATDVEQAIDVIRQAVQQLTGSGPL